MSQLKQDRFAAYNAQQRKNPPEVTKYPMMLTNDDGTTIIVQDEEEHKAVTGKHFDAESYRGVRSGKKEPEPAPAPEVVIPESAKLRKGLKAVSLDGSPIDVPPQTVFEKSLPTS